MLKKTILCFCLILTASSLFAQSNYIYKITPEDTCPSWNDDMLEVNKHYYLLSRIDYDNSFYGIPVVSVYDENLNKIKQFPVEINGINFNPSLNVFTRLFYKDNHFYAVGFIPFDTQQQESIFFVQYDEDFNILQQQISQYNNKTIEWTAMDISMTRNNDFLLLFTDYDSTVRLTHLNIAGEVLQEVFVSQFVPDGKIVETDDYYIANFLRNNYLLRFSKDSLENYEWIKIEHHLSEGVEAMIMAVGNQIIRDNVIYKTDDKCPTLNTDRSVVFLNEDLSFKKRLIFGIDCAKDGDVYRNMHYLNPDSIYYAYNATTNADIWESGGGTICIANFNSEGKLHFNHALAGIQEDSFIFSIQNIKALSNGGVLVIGALLLFDEFYPANSRGFLLLWHPTKTFTNINEHVTAECKVFPNPAQSQFTVTNTENAAVYLYNILGQKVKQVASTEENTVIQTEDLSAGMYVLKIEKGNAVVTKKVQVTK